MYVSSLAVGNFDSEVCHRVCAHVEVHLYWQHRIRTMTSTFNLAVPTAVAPWVVGPVGCRDHVHSTVPNISLQKSEREKTLSRQTPTPNFLAIMLASVHRTVCTVHRHGKSSYDAAGVHTFRPGVLRGCASTTHLIACMRAAGAAARQALASARMQQLATSTEAKGRTAWSPFRAFEPYIYVREWR